jgi:hypothetical protein
MRARRMIDHVVWAQIDDIDSRISAWVGNGHGFCVFSIQLFVRLY